jgi:predicted CXXCH cytochrome family protein
VDEKHFADSVHGQKNLTCTDCHTNIQTFPHPAFNPTDRRDVTLSMYALCRQCHEQNYTKTLDSMHARAIAGGNKNAAVCTDCHTAHEVKPPDQPRQHIPQTCAQCHNEIYKQYADSVHGAALLDTAEIRGRGLG